MNYPSAMALHFRPYNLFSSFKPQTVETKAQLPQSFNPAKLDPIPFPNKWNIIAQEQIPSAHILTPGRVCIINHSEKLEALKHALRNVVGDENSLTGLCMIDSMQRLNIDYHFQEEIEAFLRKQKYVSSTTFHEVALRFRLLRQQGHFMPAEVFDKFTDKEGKFRPNLCGNTNIKGITELYEASQLSIAGEDLLDEAAQFSKHFLKERIPYLDIHEAKLVRRTLGMPFHKSLPMFTSRNFFGDFHGTDMWWFGPLKEVAKRDYSLLQCLHQQEIVQVSKWWTALGLANELKHARNQPLKWYICSLACLTDPTLSEERFELTKPISLIYILDDIYDVYGTLDELTLFTEAVSRWEIEATEQLPDYMRTCFRVLYNLTNEISCKIYQKHGWNPTNSLRKTWERLCRAFLVEAEWFASGNLPSAEEYLRNGIVSSGVHIVLVHIFFLLGQGLNKENVEALTDTIPGIISAPATILRLWNDLGNAEDEKQQGNDGSYVNCVMMEHQEYLCIERAREHVMSRICDAWKSLNKESLFEKTKTPFPKAFTMASLNLARMVPLMYSYDDKHSLPLLEDQVKSLLYDNSLFS